MAKTPTAPAVEDVPAEVKKVRAAFDAGNFSMVRQLASASPAARAEVDTLMPKIRVEKEQILVGVVALLVVLTAAALSIVTG